MPTKKINVAVFGLRGFPNVQGGIEKHCEELYTHMSSKDYKFIIFRRKSYTKSKKKYNNITFKDIYAPKNKFLETVIHSFLATIYSMFLNVQIVHIHNMTSCLFIPLLRLAGKKVIMTYHSPNYEHNKWNAFIKECIKVTEKVALSMANEVIYLTKEQAKKCKGTTIIPNGITTFTKKPTKTLASYNLKKKEYILAVGRITKEKRFEDIIKAFNQIKTNKKLVIVGDTQNKEYLKKLKKAASKNIIFTGSQPTNNLKILYKNAYFFVLPSENEMMPIVLLEAANFGIPILASSITPNKAIIKQNGYTFKCKQVSDLKDKLNYMLANENKIMTRAKACQEDVKQNYNWKAVAKQTQQIYIKVLENES